MSELSETQELDPLTVLIPDAKNAIRRFYSSKPRDVDYADHDQVDLETKLNHYKIIVETMEKLNNALKMNSSSIYKEISAYLFYCFGKDKFPLSSINTQADKDYYINIFLNVDQKINELSAENFSNEDKKLIMDFLKSRQEKIEEFYEKALSKEANTTFLLEKKEEGSLQNIEKKNLKNTLALLNIKKTVLILEGKVLENIINAITTSKI